MYSKMQLQSSCSSRVDFQHGLSYYNEGNVERITWEECRDENGTKLTEIRGNVRGNYDDYAVRAVLDEGDSEEGTGKLIQTYCSCPGSEEKGRICKHCIAVILKYLDSREAAEDAAEIMPSYRQEVEELPSETDRVLQSILSAQNNKRRVEIKQKKREGTIRIVPYLMLSDIAVNVEFKAGEKKMYILKDIEGYVSAVNRNTPIAYGKNRSITHSEKAFDESSLRLFRFMERYVQNRMTYIKSYSAKTDDDSRTITLKKEILDNFFRSVEGQTVFVHDASAKEKKDSHGGPEEWMEEGGDQDENEEKPVLRTPYRKFTVERGIPELHFTVTGLDGRGALITGNFPNVFVGLDDYVFAGDGTFYVTEKEALEGAEPFLSYVARMDSDRIFVAEEDLHLFVPEMLQVLKRCFDVTLVDFNERKYLPAEAAIQLYLDLPRKDEISCQLFASYDNGEKRYNVLAQRDYSADVTRNEAAEMVAYEALKKYFNKYDPNLGAAVMLKGEDAFYEFITEQIFELNELGEVFVSDKLKSVGVKKASRITAGVSLQGDLLTFSVQSEDFTSAQIAEILKKYDRKKKFFRLSDGTFISVDGEGFDNLAKVGKMLDLSGAAVENGVYTVPKFRALFLDNELSDAENVEIVRNKDFRALIRNMKTFEDNDYEVPDSFAGTIRHYQKHGFRWLKTLKNNGFGGILADEMGLGKTVQAIAFLLSEYEEGHRNGAIIICPASLVYNWKNEMERFAPQLPAVVVSGKQEDRAEIIAGLGRDSIVITSYDLLRRDIAMYSGLRFGCQIIDEAQYIKNSATLSSRAVKLVSAGFRLALTGTPIENRLSELWSIFDYLMPGFLHDYRQFKEEFETPIVTFKDKEALESLRKIIRPFVLRRLKSDVLKDLPEKLEETLTARLTDAQTELYNANVRRIKDSIASKSKEEFRSGSLQILAELMRLRQICCDPALIYEDYDGGAAKVDMCIDLVKQAIDGGHKVLLFSQFTSMLDILEKRMDGEKIAYYSLVGQTSKEKRTQMVEDFNNGSVPVFCISLKAGGTGLNLTSADIVIHFDPWWNVAVQNQATDRAHRIGQRKVVTVYKLIAKGTIEENILNLQEKKKVLATELLSGEEFNTAAFSKEEILEILG